MARQLSKAASDYLYAWGTIQRAVSERAGTAAVFAAVHEVADELGMDKPPGLWRAVNELRSVAAQIRNGGEAFARASNESPFLPSMAAEDINARNLEDQALFPEYLVRFSMTHELPTGEVETIWRTTRQTWTPDLTVGEVRDKVSEAAEGLANEYGITLVSWGDLVPVTI